MEPAGPPPGLGQEWLAEHLFTALPAGGWGFWLAVLATIVLFFGALALLQQLSSPLRRRLTMVCTFLAGLFYLLGFMIPEPYNPVKGYEQPLGEFLLAVGGFTIGLGVINLCTVHGKVLFRLGAGWHNSAAFFFGFIAMAVFGIWNIYVPPSDGETAIPIVSAMYRWLFEGLLTPLQSTTFALLGFFIVSAAYRAFRVRSLEAGLMTAVAFLVMLGQVPIGQVLTSFIDPTGTYASLRLENITNWLLTQPNAAATRGIVFGSAIGSFALSLRVWLSLERGSYFGKEF